MLQRLTPVRSRVSLFPAPPTGLPLLHTTTSTQRVYRQPTAVSGVPAPIHGEIGRPSWRVPTWMETAIPSRKSVGTQFMLTILPGHLCCQPGRLVSSVSEAGATANPADATRPSTDTINVIPALMELAVPHSASLLFHRVAQPILSSTTPLKE